MRATGEDAPLLADLYSKAFSETGFNKFAAPDKRGELIAWLKELADAGKLWFMRDEQGAVTLGHYEPEKGEVITIATRDGAERHGNGEKMLRALMACIPV
jgi:streptogramin lyase